MNPRASLELAPDQKVLFASDLHLLHDDDPLCSGFLAWLEDQLRSHQPHWLVILGDLFETWVGDDLLDSDSAWPRLTKTLLREHRAGLQIGLVHGNRDFLLGPRFCQSIGATLFADPFVLTQASGRRWVISHGDAYCTDDLDYQAFRATVREPAWQHEFLAQPLEARLATAQTMRQRSQAEKRAKTLSIMDVNQSAVDGAIESHRAFGMIHGHTHRPGSYSTPSGHDRWVLTDWSIEPARQGGLLLSDDGPRLI